MFERPHHRRIARLLGSLDAALLRRHACLFGGGTAMALRFGECRESDGWPDDGVFSRDLIDLAMMRPPLPLLRRAVAKAEGAYGAAILRDLARAIDKMQSRIGWLERCMQAMAMQAPQAVVWQRVRALRRVLPPGAG